MNRATLEELAEMNERERALTEVERLREQFQAETLRTSDLHRALEALVERLKEVHWDTPHPKACATCNLMVRARAVLDSPVNVTASELRDENDRLRAVLRGDDEKANLVVSRRAMDGEVCGGNILRSVGLALGILQEEK